MFFSFINYVFPKSAYGVKGIWSEDSHIHDQMRVFGLLNDDTGEHINITEKNYKKCKKLLENFNYWIDDQASEGENKQFYYLLQEKYNNFNWHKFGHRLMFHWGFDWGDPEGHAALKKAFFNLNNPDDIELTSEQEEMFDSFINDIKKEQQRRESLMTKEVETFFSKCWYSQF